MKLKNLPVFVLCNMLLWSAASTLYFKTGGFYTDTPGLIFTCLFIPAQMGFLALFLGILCCAFFRLKPKHFAIACAACGALASACLAVDILVYSLYRFHLSMSMLQLFFGPAGREIFTFPALMWLLIILAAALIAAIQWGFVWISTRVHLSLKRWILIVSVWVLLFAGYNGMFAWGKFMAVPSVLLQRSILPFAVPLSVNRRLRNMGFEPKTKLYSLPGQGHLHYPLRDLICPEKADKNILIILVESWRADSFTPENMPLLSKRKNGQSMIYFTNHLSGGNATEAGVFSLFYSLPYAYWNDFTGRQRPPLLMSQAQKMGYTPAIFSSGRLNSPTFHQNVFAAIPNLRLYSQGEDKWQRDQNAVEDFEAFLQNPKKPFFGFVFLDAPHGNNYPPEDEVFTPAKEMNYLLLTKNTDPIPFVNSYKNSLHFTDRMIERIFKALEKHNLLNDTLVIITGDHGQEFNDTHHNNWGHNSNFSKYQTHVPLLVWYPDGPMKGARSYLTTHYDIAPMILTRIFGCRNPASDYAVGQDLFDSEARPFTILSSYTKRAVRTGKNMTVLDDYGNAEFYDDELNPVPEGADPAALKSALKTFSAFYY